MSEELRRKLKAARVKLGLSLKEAAEQWQVPEGTLAHWEHNQRTPRGLALTAINNLLDAILAEKPPAQKAVRKKR